MEIRNTALVLAILASGLLATRMAQAQIDWPEVRPGVEVGIGYTQMTWEEDLERGSYLPELVLSTVLPIHFDTTLVLQPHFGLQFDAVSYRDDDPEGYDDHHAVTSIRTGLMLLVKGGSIIVGIGPEYRKPIWVRASLRSRSEDGLEWVLFDDPDILHDDRFYWVLRLGLQRAWGRFSFDVSMDNDGRSPLASLFPDDPLAYRSLRLNLHVPLSSFRR